MHRNTWLAGAMLLVAAALPACGDDSTGSGGAGGSATTTTTTSSGGGQGGEGGAAAVCGDGAIGGDEACDDGNTEAGDGCDDACAVEAGWSCDGEPSACATTCGDGIVAGAEACDDGNADAGDGCDDACAVESGWTCDGEPSACVATCGDGIVAGAEACDDGNTAGGDGCDDACAVENGWTCDGEPSACATTCGDGIVAGAEACDDGNTAGGDGCDDACAVENGWTCNGEPSACATTCGDSIIAGAEACDDGNAAAGDGCDDTCAVESGWTCNGEPSACTTTCGDSIVAGAEACDDGNTAAGDGCDGACAQEPGYTCMGSPSACVTTCGDGIIAGAEACDDGNSASGDCCSSACQLEPDCEVESNNSVAEANGPYTQDIVIKAAVNPAGDQDYFAFTVSSVSDVRLQTFDETGPGSCNTIDTTMELLDTDGTTQLAFSDDGGLPYCSLLDPATDLALRALPPGTYYVHVNEYGDNDVIPGYTLQITYVSVCGDGAVSGSEECDDGNTTSGDGCDAACVIEATCGDGTVTPPEECDDGNTTSGDGCSAACTYESVDTEPNDSAAQATPITIGTPASASIVPSGDEDYFSFTLTTTSDVRVQTFDAGGPGSCVGIDTVIDLIDTDGTTVLVNNDDGGIPNCSLIDPSVDSGAATLPPGTYYVHVNEYLNNDPIPGYTLLVTLDAQCGDGVTEGSEDCDDGNTTSGDGCSSACRSELAETELNDDAASANGPYMSSKVYAFINPVGDNDWFAVDVASAGTTITATIVAGNGDTCGSFGGSGNIDSELDIIDVDGSTSLAFSEDIDGSNNWCSSTQATVPAPGTYYVRTSASVTYCPTCMYGYGLVISLQ